MNEVAGEARMYHDLHPIYIVGPLNAWQVGDLVSLPQRGGALVRIVSRDRPRWGQEDGSYRAIDEQTRLEREEAA